ncbi:hypothetical protein PENTCL1PPCAC_8954, partial [Pristionchus entomophagus]
VNRLQKFFTSNVSSYFDILSNTIDEAWKFMEKVLQDFDKIHVALFKTFFGKFSMIECLYLTLKHSSGDSLRFMTSLITCFPEENLEMWIEKDEQFDRKEDFRA